MRIKTFAPKALFGITLLFGHQATSQFVAFSNWKQPNSCNFAKQTFNFTGSAQTFTVPAGCASVIIKAWGAGGGSAVGGSNGSRKGGGAGFVFGRFNFSSGTVITVVVGGRPGNVIAQNNSPGSGGYPNGGSGGWGPDWSGAGGGGSSSATATGFTLRAAGGGGAGADGAGDGTAGGTNSGFGGFAGCGGSAGSSGSNGGGGGGGGNQGDQCLGGVGQGGTSIVPSGGTGFSGSSSTQGGAGDIDNGGAGAGATLPNVNAGHGKIIISP